MLEMNQEQMQSHYYGEIQVAIVTGNPEEAIAIINQIPDTFDLYFGSNELMGNAANRGYIDVIQAILNKGGNNVRQVGMLDRTLTELVKDSSKTEIIRFLFENIDFSHTQHHIVIQWFTNAMNATQMNLEMMKELVAKPYVVAAIPRAQINLLIEKCAKAGLTMPEANDFIIELQSSPLFEKGLSRPSEEEIVAMDCSQYIGLYLAALNNDQLTVSTLLAKHSFDLNHLETAIFCALNNGHDDLAGMIARKDEALVKSQPLIASNNCDRLIQARDIGKTLFNSWERHAQLDSDLPQMSELDKGMVLLTQAGIAQEVLKFTGMVDLDATKESLTAFKGLKPAK